MPKTNIYLYFNLVFLFVILCCHGCSNKIITEIEQVEKQDCKVFISNLQSDFYEIDSECNIISNVQMTVDTVYDGNGNYTLDTNFVYQYSLTPNRTKQYLVFDYAGDCLNKSTYFQVSYTISYDPEGDFENVYVMNDFSPLNYYYQSYGIIGDKIRLGICWPIYGYDVVVNYKVQAFHEGEATNVIERSFTREDFM